jgi:hypothetical protein
MTIDEVDGIQVRRRPAASHKLVNL